MFLQDFMAKKRFLYILAPFLECKKGIFFKVVAKWGKCKKIHFFCRNGLYPFWYKIYQEAMRFWKLFGILVHPTGHTYLACVNIFCCKTVKYASILSLNVKIRYFLLQNIKICAMSRKNDINCVTSWLRILSCSGLRMTVALITQWLACQETKRI